MVIVVVVCKVGVFLFMKFVKFCVIMVQVLGLSGCI